MNSSARPGQHFLKLWSVLVTCLCVLPTAVLGLELQSPPLRNSGAIGPQLLEDPDRPADAPTAQAIDAIGAEDGPLAAVTLATRALQASRIVHGVKDPRTITPLTNLGHVKQRAGQTIAALNDYRAAIELAETAGGPRDIRLFDAWYGVGHAHLAAGQVESAGVAFETALQMHRVNRGLFSAEQLDVLHALATAWRAADRNKEADELQMRRLEVAQRVHGLGTPALARAYIPIGRWYRELGRWDEAISLHAVAVDILEQHDANDPTLIEPLLELALSGGLRRRDIDGVPLPRLLQPAVVLIRAEKIAERSHPDSPVALAASLVNIGDVQLTLGRREESRRLYTRAASLYAKADHPPPFADPAFVIFLPPAVQPLPGESGYVLAEFTVETTGRTADIRIVETHPAGIPASVAARLRQALSGARMRPRIENGSPVTSRGVRYRLAVRGDSA